MARNKQQITSKQMNLLKKIDEFDQKHLTKMINEYGNKVTPKDKKDFDFAYRQQLIQKIIEGYYTFQPNAKNKRLGFIKTLVYHQLFKYLHKQIHFNDYIKSFIQIIDSDFSTLQSDINQKNIVIEKQAQQIVELNEKISQFIDRLETLESNHLNIKKNSQEIKSVRKLIANFNIDQSLVNKSIQQIQNNSDNVNQNILTIGNRLNSNFELIKKTFFPQPQKFQSPGSKVFYSQFGEDAWIVNNLKLPKIGVFVDVGAADGITFSNTYYFEKQGWTGVCFEPNPENYEIAKLARRNVDPTAISSKSGRADFYIDPSSPDWSGLDPSDINTSKKISVNTKTLTQALFDHKIKQIDLISIDTEGTEIDVLKSLDFLIFKPKIIIVEYLSRGDLNQKKDIIKIINNLSTDKLSLVHQSEANLIFYQKN